ncbi:HNH endonuclease [Bacillus phage 019DV002]|uniref:HNH endonuclease n=1 Tax=Bacillus phage 019DV002 TaxID=2601653 RepID=A0A5J6T442_9CAUD|nr:HNH endonuclease [Bacillus phage 019DV002]QFG05309.1 HNH endonuclease [Bacillus phage 019DV004]
MKNKYRIEGETVVLEITKRNGEYHECLIDKSTFEKLKAEKITVSCTPKGYFQFKKDNKVQTLHRWIMGNPNEQVDHINALRSDNRKNNLRLVTAKENARNINNTYQKNKNNVRGVAYLKGRSKPWRVQLFGTHLDYFESFEEAKEFSRIALLLHGK